jgi:hypothetical protein
VAAKAYGLNTTVIHYMLMFFLTLVAVVSLQTVGTILVIAMLITPAATAYQLTNRFSTMLFSIGLFRRRKCSDRCLFQLQLQLAFRSGNRSDFFRIFLAGISFLTRQRRLVWQK